MSGFGNLSTFNGLGDMAGTAADPFGESDGGHALPVEYGGTPIQASWYSYQAGLAGFGADPYYGLTWEKSEEWKRLEDEQREQELEDAKRYQTRQLESARRYESGQKHKEQVRQIRLGSEGRKREKHAKAYRIVQLRDGNKVKQTGTNEFKIIHVEKGTRFAKLKLRGKWVRKGSKHYDEVSGEVLACCGPFSPGATASDWMRLTAVGARTGLDLAKAFSGKKKKKRKKKKRRGRAAPAPAPAGIPTQYLLIGGGLVGVVLLIVMLKK
jgi:hypothetical protein